MSTNNNGAANSILDLDAVFGMERPLVVKWENQEHRLKPLAALDAVDIMRVEELKARIRNRDHVKDAAQAQQVEALIDEMFDILCPSMRDSNMPFLAKFRTLDWYMDQNGGMGEKKMNAPIKHRPKHKRR